MMVKSKKKNKTDKTFSEIGSAFERVSGPRGEEEERVRHLSTGARLVSIPLMYPNFLGKGDVGKSGGNWFLTTVLQNRQPLLRNCTYFSF